MFTNFLLVCQGCATHIFLDNITEKYVLDLFQHHP